MNFNEYQKESAQTAVYPGIGEFTGLAYAALGVCGEAGEVAEQVKKMWRNEGEITDERRTKILDECGDVLWYVARVCSELGFDMDTVAKMNIEKLAERKRKNALKVHE